MARSIADTMPSVTVGPPLRASALPMATTLSPTRSDDDAPSSTVWRPDAFLIFSSAMSLSLSTPTTSAWRPLVWPDRFGGVDRVEHLVLLSGRLDRDRARVGIHAHDRARPSWEIPVA